MTSNSIARLKITLDEVKPVVLRRVEVPVEGLRRALEASPVPLRTMGRDLDADEAAFLASAAAGRHAASLL